MNITEDTHWKGWERRMSKRRGGMHARTVKLIPKIITLREQGMPEYKVAKKLKCSSTTVKKMFWYVEKYES